MFIVKYEHLVYLGVSFGGGGLKRVFYEFYDVSFVLKN